MSTKMFEKLFQLIRVQEIQYNLYTADQLILEVETS